MHITNRTLFRLTRFLLLNIPPLLIFLSKFRRPKKRLLIVKTDAIGDYILFRNYIEIVKQSELYKDYEIDLLGNRLWQDIAINYDTQYVNAFFFVNPETLYQAPLTTLTWALRLFRKKYLQVLQPTQSRTFIGDALAAFSGARNIIGFEGTTERINQKYKTKTDKFYTQLLKVPPGTIFEFEVSRFFFETLLNKPVTIDRPIIKIKNTNKNGVVIFPGAGASKRNWEADKFLSLIRLILTHTSQSVYIAGGHQELLLAAYLVKNLPAGGVNNLTGKTSLLQMIELIDNAALVISCETSAVHIAAATETKSICILGGGHFNRFMPYSENQHGKPLCVFEKMDCYNCNWNCKFYSHETEPYPCIADIDLERVWLETIQLLSAI